MTFRRTLPPLLGLVCAIMVFGQTTEKTPETGPSHVSDTLRVDVDLVLVPVTVTDSHGRYVKGLRKENFTLWEDKVQQDVEYFSAENIPASVGIVLDVSGSMKDKLSAARSAAVTFMKIGGRQDEYFLITFGNDAEFTSGFTTDIAHLQDRIAFTQANGMTALYDAVYLGLDRVNQGNNTRKALLLITDGDDNHSRYSYSNVKEFAKERDVQIYAIGIVDPIRTQYGAATNGRAALRDLSRVTGGRAFFPDSPFELEAICTQIGFDLKNQYVLGYRSSNLEGNGKWRNIKVKIDRQDGMPRMNVRAKSGYYAPTVTKALR
jgi:Ca-activated chloride channel homolog